MAAEVLDRAGDQASNKTALSTGFQDLLKIEKSVLSCVDLSADLVEELAKVGEADKQKAYKICNEFMNNVQNAQQTVVSAVEKHHGPRDFEVTIYPSLAKSYIVAEKVKVLQLHLKEMEKWMNSEG